MRLESLHINRIEYGEFNGQLRGRIKFTNGSNTIETSFGDTLSKSLIAVCSEELIVAGKEAANMLVDNIIEHTKQLT